VNAPINATRELSPIWQTALEWRARLQSLEQIVDAMAWFEIVYSVDPTGKALFSKKIDVRDPLAAAAAALSGFADAHATLGAQCYRVIDGGGLVVAHGPNSAAPS
jgi:hypothetical protein